MADIVGTPDNDTLNGTGNAETIIGLAGDDTLNGGAGNDTLYGDENEFSTDGYTIAGNDTLNGGDGFDFLYGGAGTDIMTGGTGSDVYGVHEVTDVVTELPGEGDNDTVQSTISYTLGANVEDLILYGIGLVGTGNALNNQLSANGSGMSLYGLAGDDWLWSNSSGGSALDGGSGNDRLFGFEGAETLTGGTGNDSLDGGAGSDTASYAGAAGAVTVNLQTSNPQNTVSAGIDTLISIENVAGSNFADSLTGNSGANALFGVGGQDRLIGLGGNDALDGGSGADVMRGGLGNDTYHVDNGDDRPIENAGEGTDRVFSSISFSLASNIENLTITGAAVRATGNASDNSLVGNISANVLNGGAGSDVMRGGLGNDTYYVGEGRDTVIEASGAGRDRVYTNVDFTLGANVEDLFLRGSDPLGATGNSLDNVLRGNGASNELTGGAGADDLRGGGEADSFVFADGDFGGLTASTSDRIIDFSHAEGDAIDLTGVDANSLLADHQAFDFIGTNAFSNVAGQLRFEQVNGNTYLYGDIDGNGIADLMIRLDGNQTLLVGDFIL
ncbi:MAG TPA: calcium-binding protein [Sphingomicrobium sp.]|nr:calcium-binding protein [Sphingomicrobium sp.]